MNDVGRLYCEGLNPLFISMLVTSAKEILLPSGILSLAKVPSLSSKTNLMSLDREATPV